MSQCLCIIYFNIVKIIKKTTGSLWNYHREEPNSDTDDN